jgi:hypothetical protein
MATNINESAEWLTTSQAARIIDCHPRVLQRLATEGRIACTRTPLGRLFPAGEVRAFAANREHSVQMDVP